MANVYTVVIPRPAAIPTTVEVRIVAGRPDGEDLTAEELAALRATYPNLVASKPPVPARRAKPEAKAKAPAGTTARKPAPKRAAAKRPASL